MTVENDFKHLKENFAAAAAVFVVVVVVVVVVAVVVVVVVVVTQQPVSPADLWLQLVAPYSMFGTNLINLSYRYSCGSGSARLKVKHLHLY